MDAQAQGVLPVPRGADGAVGRSGVDRVHRRHGDRRGARPQRPAPVALLGHRRRPRDHGERGRRARRRPEQDRAEGPARAGQDLPRRHRRRAASSPTTRSRPSSPAQQPYQEWLDAGPRAPRRPAAAVPARAAAQLGGAAAAHVRLHRGRPAPDHRPDGAQRGRVARLDGHRHAGAGALRPAADALRVLQAAVRAGHEPAARRQLRGARHVAQLDDRARGQPARPDRRVVPPDRVRVADPHQRGAREAALHRRRRLRGAGLHAVHRVLPLPGRRGRRRAAHGDRQRAHAGERGDRRRRQPHDPLRPLRRRRERADPRAAHHRGGAPPPRAREDAHAGRARRRDGRGARGASLRAAARLRRGRRSTRTSRSTRSATSCREGVLVGPHRAQGRQELREGRGQGHPQGDVEDGHLHRRVLHRRADLRGGRAAASRSSTSTSPAPRRASRASTST